jgi:hypothetical protein
LTLINRDVQSEGSNDLASGALIFDTRDPIRVLNKYANGRLGGGGDQPDAEKKDGLGHCFSAPYSSPQSTGFIVPILVGNNKIRKFKMAVHLDAPR